ncbi:hypothetical protein [Actinoplanes sp. NBRC 103695]|uniref:hypothetical protein n=1 Tax=Actinoplanes sp. NBRC 103695 TaxID=3032202 RepID=UPI0024A1B392|nr:hypothetical protein [Actinoplanes sp. NBRC 103695]GLY97069.1 hypothetical protein Acsp02_43230 [Actinoplanes sp. NBRC 103695]
MSRPEQRHNGGEGGIVQRLGDTDPNELRQPSTTERRDGRPCFKGSAQPSRCKLSGRSPQLFGQGMLLPRIARSRRLPIKRTRRGGDDSLGLPMQGSGLIDPRTRFRHRLTSLCALKPYPSHAEPLRSVATARSVAQINRWPERTKVDGVQPPEPSSPPTQPTPAVPLQGAPPPPAKHPNRRARLILAMIAGIAALLCLGGLGVAVSLYDDATEIKRDAPDAVVDSFLRAYLVDRDDKQAELFMCEAQPKLAAISALRDENVKREKDFGVSVGVSWSSLLISGSGSQRLVTTDLTIAGRRDGQTQSRRTETWSFHLVDNEGWRVCGANKEA